MKKGKKDANQSPGIFSDFSLYNIIRHNEGKKFVLAKDERNDAIVVLRGWVLGDFEEKLLSGYGKRL